jgi:hypothetical protein
MRDYRIYVPADCSACVDMRDHEYALRFMQRVLKADIHASNQLELDALIGAKDGNQGLPDSGTNARENS